MSTSDDASPFLRAAAARDQSQRYLYSWYESVTKRSKTDGNAAIGSALMRVKRSNLPAAVLFYIGLILSVAAIVVVLVHIYQRRARASQEQQEEIRKDEQTKGYLQTKREILKKTTMIIEEEDFVRLEVATKKQSKKFIDLEAGGITVEAESDLDDANSRVSDVSVLHLMDEYRDRGERPPVLFWASTNCAICLGEYEPGDAITWSTNARCHHAYHNECLFSWFAKGHDTCPFCREEFCPMEEQGGERGGSGVEKYDIADGRNQSRRQQIMAARSA